VAHCECESLPGIWWGIFFPPILEETARRGLRSAGLVAGSKWQYCFDPARSRRCQISRASSSLGFSSPMVIALLRPIPLISLSCNSPPCATRDDNPLRLHSSGQEAERDRADLLRAPRHDGSSQLPTAGDPSKHALVKQDRRRPLLRHSDDCPHLGVSRASVPVAGLKSPRSVNSIAITGLVCHCSSSLKPAEMNCCPGVRSVLQSCSSSLCSDCTSSLPLCPASSRLPPVAP